LTLQRIAKYASLGLGGRGLELSPRYGPDCAQEEPARQPRRCLILAQRCELGLKFPADGSQVRTNEEENNKDDRRPDGHSDADALPQGVAAGQLFFLGS
jgi:hypothetical protein